MIFPMDIRLQRIGNRIRSLREGMGFTQADLSRQLEMRFGVSVRQNHISNIESGDGKRLPSIPVLIGIAEALETSTDYLLGLTDNQLSAADIDRELATGGLGGRLGDILADLTDDQRQQLLHVGEAMQARNEMDHVRGLVADFQADLTELDALADALAVVLGPEAAELLVTAFVEMHGALPKEEDQTTQAGKA
jgi:transcriptional regulator with XRE-family HTH domain